MKLSLLVAALITGLAASARGQVATVTQQGTAAFDPTTLDPSVMLVFTGGRWNAGAQRGGFRILVLGDRWDRRRDRVVIQWLEEQRQARRVAVYASREVDTIPAGIWALDPPRLEMRNGQWYAVITGTTDAGRIRRTWRFDLGVPGKLREVQPR